MNPLSVMLAITFAGFVASLALLGMTREPATAAGPVPPGRRRHSTSGPRRPRRYRSVHRADGSPLEDLPVVVVAAGAAVVAGGMLAAYAASAVSRMPGALVDVVAVLLGTAL